MTAYDDRYTWDEADEQQLPMSERMGAVAYELYQGQGCWKIHRIREDKSSPNHTHIVKRIYKSIVDAVDKARMFSAVPLLVYAHHSPRPLR